MCINFRNCGICSHQCVDTGSSTIETTNYNVIYTLVRHCWIADCCLHIGLCPAMAVAVCWYLWSSWWWGRVHRGLCGGSGRGDGGGEEGTRQKGKGGRDMSSLTACSERIIGFKPGQYIIWKCKLLSLRCSKSWTALKVAPFWWVTCASSSTLAGTLTLWLGEGLQRRHGSGYLATSKPVRREIGKPPLSMQWVDTSFFPVPI